MDNIAGLCLFLITLYTSYRGLQDTVYFSKYAFRIDRIQVHKEYKRLITSGFLHADWIHLIFNMIAMYSFAGGLESLLGIPKLLLVYFGSLICGNLLSLYIHRNNSAYTAIGASGAVSGLVYASIALFPGIELSLLFLPVFIPGWAFGLLYTAYTIYGIRSKRDNIGHEAHLGGGLTGMIIGLILYPDALLLNMLPILVILIPSLIFLYFVFTRPEFLITGTLKPKTSGTYTIDDRYHTIRRNDEKELDRLLEKIHKTGMESLSKPEREKLEKLSGKS